MQRNVYVYTAHYTELARVWLDNCLWNISYVAVDVASFPPVLLIIQNLKMWNITR